MPCGKSDVVVVGLFSLTLGSLYWQTQVRPALGEDRLRKPAVNFVARLPEPSEHHRFERFPETAAIHTNGRVHLKEPSHPISDGIYGVCDLPPEKLRDYGITITRWGGNTSSRYNWKINADNGAKDWYFLNRGEPIRDLTETAYLKHIQRNQRLGATTYQTVPMLGWVAKDNHSAGFSVKKYGPQRQTEPWHPDAGNGIDPNGKLIRARDPRDTSLEAPPEFVAEAVRFVVRHAGPAVNPDGCPGVKYWVLDNEPMLWQETHRDVRPDPLGYDELWARTVQYAEAIKKADPTCKVAGFCSWGWTDLFYSAKDEGGNGYASQPDFNAHNKVPLAEWFIKKCGEYKRLHGRSLVDVFDFHWYPQAQVFGKTPYQARGMNERLNHLRLRTTRDLWDPNYEQESWCRHSGDCQPTAVIRRVRQWIDKHNPGMEICLGEYNFGGCDNITGALAQAETFGILAREKVDLAFIWSKPEGSQELAWQLFRNYDGQGNRFGDRFLKAESNHPDVSIFASRRSKDQAITIVVVNKNLGSTCHLNLDLPGCKGKREVWRFDQDGKIEEVLAERGPVDGKVKLTLPAASASMIVLH